MASTGSTGSSRTYAEQVAGSTFDGRVGRGGAHPLVRLALGPGPFLRDGLQRGPELRQRRQREIELLLQGGGEEIALGPGGQ